MPASTNELGVEPMIIGVTGGKGGTGKTVFAVNLAVALAEKGAEVRLIDCDVDCPGAHIVLGAKLGSKQKVESFVPRIDASKCKRCGLCVEKCEQHSLFQLKGEAPTIIDKMCNGCRVCSLVCGYGAITGSEKTIGWTYKGKELGVELFSGELKPSEPLSEKVVGAVKERGLNGEAEVTIIDTSAGAHCNVVRALQRCDRAYAITEPTLLGAHDLKVISSVLRMLKIPGEVVLNRCDIAGTRVKSSFEIPYSRELLESYIRGIPLVAKNPGHPISEKFFSLAEGLLREHSNRQR